MAEYARVVTFDADEAAIAAVVKEIESSDGPPPGVTAKKLTVLADRAAGKLVISVGFGSEEDLRKGAEVFEAMSPPAEGGMRRVSVDQYEVVLERDA
jgi:hypothetical protein